MEISSLAEIEPLLVEATGTWLILDIDHTLLRAPDHYGGEPYYYHRIDAHRAAGLAEEAAVLAGNDDWERAQLSISPIALEADAAARVRAWQNRGLTVCGLTARRLEIAALTRRHLAAVGFDLSRTAPALTAPFYERGIAYVGPLARKGDELAKLLGGARPARIVFVDDRAEHLRTVGDHCARLGIAYQGCRHRAGDELFRNFVINF